MGVQSLEAFRVKLDGASSNLFWRNMSLSMAGVGLDESEGPSQPKPFCESVIILGARWVLQPGAAAGFKTPSTKW